MRQVRYSRFLATISDRRSFKKHPRTRCRERAWIKRPEDWPVLARFLNGEDLRLGAIAVGPLRILTRAGFQFARSIAQQLSELLHTQVPEGDVKNRIDAYRQRNLGRIERILGKYSLAHLSRNLPLVRALRSAISMHQQGAAAALGLSHGLSSLVAQLAWAGFPASERRAIILFPLVAAS